MSLIDRSNIDAALPSIFCCLGSKGYIHIRNEERGLNNCGDNKYAIRLSKVLACWYPEGYVIREFINPYFVIALDPVTSFPHAYSLFVPNGIGGSISLYNGIATSALDIATFINANTSTTGFTAAVRNDALWLSAPIAGYNGVTPTGSLISAIVIGKTIITTGGFQNGCEEIIANAPCIDNDQVERILEYFKKECNICISTVTTTSFDPPPG